MQRGAATLLSPTVVHCPLSSAQSDRGEYRTEDGLVKGHAYSVTGTHKVRNPQGGLARCVWAPNSPLTMPPSFLSFFLSRSILSLLRIIRGV